MRRIAILAGGSYTFWKFRKREKRFATGCPLSASNPNGGTSPVMTHNENSHDVADDAKQKMIREGLQVHAAEITLANREGFCLIESDYNQTAVRQGITHTSPFFKIEVAKRSGDYRETNDVS
jgi:hypothetical protein